MALSTKFHLWHIVAVTFIGGGNWSHWQIWSRKVVSNTPWHGPESKLQL